MGGKTWALRATAMITLLAALLSGGCQSKTPLLIGYAASLTGITSELGVSGRNGASLAVDQINRQSGVKGRPLQLLVKDDRNSPEEALRVDEELLAAGAKVIIGHLTTGANLGAMPLVDSDQILLISPTVSAETLNEKDDNFFRLIGSNRLQATRLAETAYRREKVTRMALVYDPNNKGYADLLCQGFQEDFTALGGQVLLVSTFTSGCNESAARLAGELVSSGAQGVLISASGADTALLCQQIKKIKPEIKIFTGMWAMTNELLQNGGPAVEGLYLTGIYDRDSQRPALVAFQTEYLEQYGEAASFSALLSYEAVHVLAAALEQCRDMEPRTVKESLLRGGPYVGTNTPEIVFDSYGDIAREYELFQVADGNFKWVTP